MTKNIATDPDTLKQLVHHMGNQNVLVIGDIMLDRFIYGSVDRISPESPVPVLNIKRENTMLGGSGNALSSIAGLKCAGHILAICGDDADGQALGNITKDLGLRGQHLLIDTSRPTTVKSRYLAGHQQLLRTDFEKSAPLDETMEDQVIQAATDIIATMQAVLISDYGKGMLTHRVLKAVITAARKKGIPVVVDPKGRDFSKYAGATALTPNKKELSLATADLPVESDEDVIHAARTLAAQAEVSYIVATRSQDGMSIVPRDESSEVTHLRTTALEVFDVSGAGDVVIATITAALAAGGSIEQAGALANIAGGIAVSKVGTTPIRAKELLDALDDEGAASHIQPASEKSAAERMLSAPICDADEAKEQIDRWRARGLKVGFTNGCFDILHLGHVSYLNQARSQCDRLIIGLNTDASVKALKGPSRPVHDEDSRSAVLSALGSVDMVVMFGGQSVDDDQTARGLLGILKPDIYFKGGDYKVEDIPETPTVQAYGGEVKVLSAFDGHSTTASIKKINASAA